MAGMHRVEQRSSPSVVLCIVWCLPKLPNLGKMMAANLQKAIILHTFGVQAGVGSLAFLC